MATTTNIQVRLDRLNLGDPQARAELVALSMERVRRIAQRMLRQFPRVGRWEETDDISQQALLRLYDMLLVVRVPTVRAYFALAGTHIRYLLLDLLRRYRGPMSHAANHATPHGHELDPLAAAPSQADEPLHLLIWEEFHRRIENLPAQEQEVWNLHWYHGVTLAQVAELMNLPLGTVKRLWQDARLRVGAHLNDGF